MSGIIVFAAFLSVAGFIQEGPAAGELKRAKKNITGRFPPNPDSNPDRPGYIAAIGFYDLALDYLATLTDRVPAVTADEVREAFQRRVHPDTFFKVIVGGGARE